MQKSKNLLLNAFINLRSEKDLEKISVIELCKLAGINKSTFYVYYNDIYDLSNQIEDDLIEDIVASIDVPDNITENVNMLTMLLCQSFEAKRNLINIVFSGSRQNVLPWKIEKKIKDLIFSVYPEYKEDIESNIRYSYIIYGCYYTYMRYQDIDCELAVNMAAKLSERVASRAED